MKIMKFSDMKKLIFSIFVCLFAGFIGSFFITPAISTWYAMLQKPSFAPPNWAFFPVWTSLFIMMGISLFLIFVLNAGFNIRFTYPVVVERLYLLELISTC